MRSSVRRRGTILSLVVCLTLAIGAGPALGGNATLQVKSISVAGDTLRVQVVNTGEKALSGTVVAQAVVGGKEVSVFAAIKVPAKGQVIVNMVFPSSTTPVVPLGVILDDGPPL
jgi:hypothetical protein